MTTDLQTYFTATRGSKFSNTVIDVLLAEYAAADAQKRTRYGQVPKCSEQTLGLYWPKLHFDLLRICYKHKPYNKSKVYSKYTTSESIENRRPTTASRIVMTLYSLLYDLLSNKSSTDRSGGVWVTVCKRMCTRRTDLDLEFERVQFALQCRHLRPGRLTLHFNLTQRRPQQHMIFPSLQSTTHQRHQH